LLQVHRQLSLIFALLLGRRQGLSPGDQHLQGKVQA
jgi:hypothetical protein